MVSYRSQISRAPSPLISSTGIAIPHYVKLDRHRRDRHESGGYEDSYHNHRAHPRGPSRPSDSRFEEDDDDFRRHRRRRGSSPSNYRIGIGGGGGGNGGRRWEDDTPKDFDGPGDGGFRQMNGPPDRVDFKPMGPHHGGSFRPMGFAYDDGFRPMGPNGGVGGEGTRSIVGARYNYPAKYPPSESPDRRRFIGKAMESDYSVRPTTPPVQQPLSGQKRGYPISDHGSFTGTGKHEFTLLSSMYIYSCSLLRFLSVSYFCGNQ